MIHHELNLVLKISKEENYIQKKFAIVNFPKKSTWIDLPKRSSRPNATAKACMGNITQGF